MKNNVWTLEPFIDCRECGRKQHQICVLYLESYWPNGFMCDSCLATKGAARSRNKFNSANLPITQLDRHIEMRVNNYQKKMGIKNGTIRIRTLLNSKRVVEVKSAMRDLYVKSGEMESQFPYKLKGVFAFQTINDVDLCFFGMYVQEYGSECPAPNTRQICITFLDSVNLYQPSSQRTAVFHEILLGYMDYVKGLGYASVHIWSCPPPDDENYIFYKHPSDQKTPNESRLNQWYGNVLKKGKNENIVLQYESLLKLTEGGPVNIVTQLPYFQDDFWPAYFEESISNLNLKMKSKRPNKIGFGRKYRKNTSKKEDNRESQLKKDLKAKVRTKMKTFEKSFIRAQLNSTESITALDVNFEMCYSKHIFPFSFPIVSSRFATLIKT